MTETNHIAIVGGGAAGVSAIRTLRGLGYTRAITLIDADANGAYERPPLSKVALLDPSAAPADFSLLSLDDLAALEVEGLFGDPVKTLDTQSPLRLTLGSGQVIYADKVLLTVGGRARQLKLPGFDLDGVYTLRDFADAERIRNRLARAKTVSVIGGGLIGAECVAAFLKREKRVHWIDAATTPLAHILPERFARVIVKKHVEAGARLFPNASLASFEGNRQGITAIQFADGSRLPTDLAVVGVGMEPRLEVAQSARLSLKAGGVQVDQNQQTSCANVFAAGDVAAVPNEQAWHREEHWRAAEVQGECAAHTMLGKEYVAPDASWFWSDQGDHHIEMVGRKGERSIERVSERGLASFEFEKGQLVGAASLNDPNAVRVAVRLLKAGRTPSESDLTDPNTDLRRLLRA